MRTTSPAPAAVAAPSRSTAPDEDPPHVPAARPLCAPSSRRADTRDAAWQGRSQTAEMLATRLQEKSASFKPEILAMGAAAVEAEIAKDPKLAPYDHYLRSTLQDGKHTLDADREALLASAGTA